MVGLPVGSSAEADDIELQPPVALAYPHAVLCAVREVEYRARAGHGGAEVVAKRVAKVAQRLGRGSEDEFPVTLCFRRRLCRGAGYRAVRRTGRVP